MDNTVTLARLNGVAIGANWSTVPLLVLVGAVVHTTLFPTFAPQASTTATALGAAATAIGFVLSILVHELGHAYIAINHGMRVYGITLWLLGGATRIDPPNNPRTDYRVAAAGPVASILLGLFLVGFNITAQAIIEAQVLSVTLWWLALMNIALGLFNLIPAMPLDGGRLLAAYLWHQWGDRHQARIVAGRAGLAVGGVLLGVGIVQLLGLDVAGFLTGVDPIIVREALNGLLMAGVGAFILRAALDEIRSAAVARRIGNLTLGDVALRHPNPIPHSVALDRLVAEFALRPAEAADSAYPVSNWGSDIVGYVVPSKAKHIDPTKHSRMTVADIATPLEQVEPVNEDTLVADAVDTWSRNDQILLVFGSTTTAPVGTVTPKQASPLLVRPDFWGRDRPQLKESSRS